MGSGLCARLWAILAVGAASFWILDASDAPKPRACQTVGSGLCETVGGVAQAVGSGLWRAKSFFSSGPKLPFKRLKPLKPLKRFDTCQWLRHTSGFWTLQTLHGRFRRSKTSHLLDCGLDSARLWAELRRLWARGSGAPNPFFLVARNRLQTPQTPETPQTPRTLPMVLPYWPLEQPASGFWTLQTLQNLALARLWALGSVRDCGRSCADCGLGALARQILFSSGPKLPFTRLKPLKPLKPLDKLPMVLPYFWILDASDAPKPRTC